MALVEPQLIISPAWKSHRGMNTTHQLQSTCHLTRIEHIHVVYVQPNAKQKR